MQKSYSFFVERFIYFSSANGLTETELKSVLVFMEHNLEPHPNFLISNAVTMNKKIRLLFISSVVPCWLVSLLREK
jgi:hypothetical protein